jgi:hypothetical protein
VDDHPSQEGVSMTSTKHQYFESDEVALAMKTIFSLSAELFRMKVEVEELSRRVAATGAPQLEGAEREAFDAWVSEQAGEMASWLWEPLQPPAEALVNDNAKYL